VHEYTLPGIYSVSLIANSLEPDFCTDTNFLLIRVEDTSFVFVPNVFTPNNDGFNDYFTIRSHYLNKCTLKIFNRWGTLVYAYNGLAVKWDGTSMAGYKVSDGTYYYILEAEGYDRKNYEKSGVITLIR
jgi:gliding motility-associated-like protein